jgi:hypothetical protein
MNEVGFHNFMGKCGIDVVKSLFPRSEMRFVTAEQMEGIVFEEPTGHEDTILYLYQYLNELEKYDEGIIIVLKVRVFNSQTRS